MIVGGAAIALFIALTPTGRAGAHTALFLTEVLDSPVKPQAWFTREPVHHEVRYASQQGVSTAQVYRVPDDTRKATVLLSLGITDQGFADPNVVNLGNALARAGFVVAYQWSPVSGTTKTIDPSQIDDILAGFVFLEQQDYVDAERVGLGGFSIGASFALVAAADDRIRDRVHFVNALGPFFDAEELLRQSASRQVTYDGGNVDWEPDAITMEVITNELTETLESEQEAELLARHFLDSPDSPELDIPALTDRGRTVARLLEGVSPREANTLYMMLPAEFREELVGVSPSSHVDGVQARLLVMHDRDDALVPVTHSRLLVESMRGKVDVRYTELLNFEHIAPEDGGFVTILTQAVGLYPHMYEIIRIAR